jgi:FkbM family methyltransferase
VTNERTLRILGAAGRSARRVGLKEALNVMIDVIDGVLLRVRTPPLAAKVGGLELRGYLRHRGFLDYLARGMAEERYYRDLVLGAIDHETIFVDIGAHIGVYTLLTCRNARRVLAFEPDPYNLAALEHNLSKRGCDNVEVHAAAVADAPGRAHFRAFRSTFSGSLVPREVDEYRELETDLVRLDDVLDGLDLGALVVKLDVEGAEPRALAGMRKAIRRANRLVLFVEVNPAALEAGGSSAAQLISDLLATSMDCAYVDERRRVLVPLRGGAPPMKGNLICRKGFAG